MLGENFVRLENAVGGQLALDHGALSLAEQIGQHAQIGYRDRIALLRSKRETVN